MGRVWQGLKRKVEMLKYEELYCKVTNSEKQISSGESNSLAAGQEIRQFIELGSHNNIQKCALIVHTRSQSSPLTLILQGQF
jgi:hypothetical protein